MGKPVYSIKRMILETGKPFGDGAHILYVNGKYRGDSDIGRLMHDFNCTNAGEMNFELMAERTRNLKENPEGESQMSKVIEEMRREEREAGMKEGLKEGLREGMKTAALRMLEAGKYALEDIAGISGLSLDEVKKLQAGQGM